MPALQPPPRHPSAQLPGGALCPRCGAFGLNPITLCCICGAEFTPAGLEHYRSLPPEQALRRD